MMTLQCPECGWTKTFTDEQAEEYISGLTFFDCPNCGHEWDPARFREEYPQN